MKKKRILSSILTLGILTGSAFGMSDLVEKNSLTNKFIPNVVYSDDVKVKVKDIANKDLKLDSENVIKKYFKLTPDFEKMKIEMVTHTIENQKDDLDKTINYRDYLTDEQKADAEIFIKKMLEFQKNENIDEKDSIYGKEKSLKIENERVKGFEEMKKNIEYGYTHVYLKSDDANFCVSFDDKTQELLSASYEKNMKGEDVNSKDFVSIEDARKVADKFLIEHKLDDIEKLKLIDQEEFERFFLDAKVGGGLDFNAVAFFYEDENDSNKNANVIVDRISGKVTQFNLGKDAVDVSYKTSSN